MTQKRILDFGGPARRSERVREQFLAGGLIDGSVHAGYRFIEVSVDSARKTFEIHAEPVDDSAAGLSFTLTDEFKVRYARGRRVPAGRSGEVVTEGVVAPEDEERERERRPRDSVPPAR